MKCQALFSLKKNNNKKKNGMLSAIILFSTVRVRNKLLHFMQIVSLGDNLHEM